MFLSTPRRIPQLLAGAFLLASFAPAAEMVPPRTTAIKLHNKTDKTLILGKHELAHGDWTPKLSPPAVIKPGETGYWKSESNELGTNGTRGDVHYRMGDPVWVPPFGLSPDGSSRAGSAVVGCDHDPTQIDIFWVAANGSINSVWWNVKPGKWSAPFMVAPAGTVRADSPLVVLSRVHAHMDLFWIGPNGAVGTMAWSLPGNKWTAPGPISPAGSAAAGSSLASAARESNHIDVFWIGANGTVETAWWAQGANNNKWAKPLAITPANYVRADSALSATTRTTNEVHVFFVSKDDSISSTFWTKQQNKWVPPFRVTRAATVGAGSHLASLARTPDHIEVFWVNRDGAVSTAWADRKSDGGKWTQPAGISPAKSAKNNSPLLALSRVTDHIDLMWIAPNGAVTSNFWAKAANKGQWSGPFSLSGAVGARLDSGLVVLARVSNHVDVFWLGAKGALTSSWWDENNVPEVYISWDNPFISSQYGNTYHQSSPDHYELSFTGGPGDHAEADYLLAKTKLHAVKGFKPSTHGFHFSNDAWKTNNIKIPVVEISLPKPVGKIDISNSTQGLCGGMTYSVIDYFQAKQKIPQTTDPPARENDPLFHYLKERLMASWDVTGRGGDYIKFMQPEYPDGDEGVPQGLSLEKGRSFIIAREEWPKIKADIDANRLSPLGLVQVRSLNPVDVGKNHQVLAYAYELSNNNVTLHIYDPNLPLNDTVQLKFNVGNWAGRIDVHRFVGGKSEPNAINTIFRTNYAPPPASLKRP